MKKLIFLFSLLIVLAIKTFAQATLVQVGGTSGNGFTGYVANKHTLAYDPDLNLLVFGHRGGGVGGGTGNQIHYDYSTNGGWGWIPQVAMTNPQPTNLTRYPQLCIWNPAGNTDIANAKTVVTGPYISNPDVRWSGSYLAWATLPAALDTNYTFQTIPNVLPTAIDYQSYAMCNLNGGMGYISNRLDSATVSMNNHVIDFWKIVPNGNGGFTRSIKFTSEPAACPFADTADLGYDMAFGPNGNTGYISHTTADRAGQRDNEYSRTPILYKTTDAGETWTKQNFIDLHAIQMIMDSTTATVGSSGIKRPTVTDSRIVVDDLGRCHLFAEISGGLSTCTDSIWLTNSAANARFVVHFIINGNSIQTNFVYRNRNIDGNFGALSLAFNAQHQAARSADGKNVFFTAVQSLTPDNTTPNLFVYAYNRTTNTYMPMRDITTGTNAEAFVFFPRMSPVVMNAASGHKLPIMLMVPGQGPLGERIETEPTEGFYINDVAVLPADYTNAMPTATTLAYNSNGSTVCVANAPCQALSGGVTCTLFATAQTTQNVSCFGGNNGSVQVTATGGTAPYSYIWGSFTNCQSTMCNGSAGTYTVTVQDANGCTASASAMITEPTQFTTSITNITNLSCYGMNNGSATAVVADGVPPYMYAWDNAQTFPTVNNLYAGVHTVTVTDANGCTTTTSLIVTQPNPFVVSFITTQDYICSGAPLCAIASGGTAGAVNLLNSNGSWLICGNGGPYAPTDGSNPPPALGYQFSWDTGDNVIATTSCIAVTQARTYYVTATDVNGCTSTNFYTVQNNYNPCVFPGDANADGIADNTDLLPIALSNALTGNARLNATTQWTPQTTQDWTSNIPNTTTNQKHADCNGDGVILSNDTLSILQNYGQTHQRAPQMITNLNDPPITCIFTSDTTQALTYPYNLKANVTIGSAAIPAQGIHGIAFTIDYDPTVAGSAYINLANTSWLGAANELYHIQHDDGQGHLDVAISRFDGQQRGGVGIVAEAGFVITDNVIGRSPNGFNYPFNVTVSGVKAINAQNVVLPVNGVPTQTVLKNMVLATNANPLAAKISISPNPTHDILNIRTNGVNIERLVLTNMIGQVLLSQNGDTLNMTTTRAATTLSLSDLPQGTYFLIIDTPQGRLTQKVVRL